MQHGVTQRQRLGFPERFRFDSGPCTTVVSATVNGSNSAGNVDNRSDTVQAQTAFGGPHTMIARLIISSRVGVTSWEGGPSYHCDHPLMTRELQLPPHNGPQYSAQGPFYSAEKQHRFPTRVKASARRTCCTLPEARENPRLDGMWPALTAEYDGWYHPTEGVV